jgi:PncC family amidohydrolase
MKDLYPVADIEAVKAYLLERRWTVAVAESVTAGHVQAALSQAESARLFFQGGVTVYNVGQKCRQLGVDPVHALECNGVSAEVAREMASNVVRLFCSQIGMAITGYAAPVPEKGVEKPFAFFCIYGPAGVLRESRLEVTGEPLDVQLFYMRRMMAELRAILAGISG